ncbi:hypothetical protein ACI2KH_14925 [Roseomonas mucosa]|uniref:hypothetical protein n=1 Tax=Roseomonas mucosa TaxID=207340 RepID=UPI00384BF6CD
MLLTPCVDYVVTFAHLGRADAKPLLAATRVLLLLQMALLPVYLGLLLNEDAARLVRVGPFVHAFLWLIAVPFALAGLMQLWAGRAAGGARAAFVLGVLPVPATAIVLLMVMATVVPRLGRALDAVLTVIPVYVLFALLAPLVVLPFALSIPGALPVLPAIIIAQTLVELIGELVYIRAIRRLGQTAPA